MIGSGPRSFDELRKEASEQLRYWRIERAKREEIVKQRNAEWQGAGTNTYREALRKLNDAKSSLGYADSMVRKYESEATHD